MINGVLLRSKVTNFDRNIGKRYQEPRHSNWNLIYLVRKIKVQIDLIAIRTQNLKTQTLLQQILTVLPIHRNTEKFKVYTNSGTWHKHSFINPIIERNDKFYSDVTCVRDRQA